MTQNSKKFSPFDNKLFSNADIDIIDEKIEKNIGVMMADDGYLDNDDILTNLDLKLNNSLDDYQQIILDKYLDAFRRSYAYQNCLAYYLGVKEGLNLNTFD